MYNNELIKEVSEKLKNLDSLSVEFERNKSDILAIVQIFNEEVPLIMQYDKFQIFGISLKSNKDLINLMSAIDFRFTNAVTLLRKISFSLLTVIGYQEELSEVAKQTTDLFFDIYQSLVEFNNNVAGIASNLKIGICNIENQPIVDDDAQSL